MNLLNLLSCLRHPRLVPSRRAGRSVRRAVYRARLISRAYPEEARDSARVSGAPFGERWITCLALFMGVVLLVSTSAQAVVVAPVTTLRADYLFQGTFTSAVAGAPPLSPLGSVGFLPGSVDGVSHSVLQFSRNDGFGLAPASGLFRGGSYTIVILFSFDEVSGWRRIVDFKNAMSDTGLYSLNGALNFYNVALGASAPIVPGNYVQVVLTRDFSQTVVGYIDGVSQFTFADTSQFAMTDGTSLLRFFRDEDPVAPNEASSGSIARLRIYDGALTPSQVAALDRVSGVPTSTVQFLTAIETRMEGDGDVVLNVSRSGNTQGAASVDWAVAGGTATPDFDFSGGSGTLLFGPGQASASIHLFLIDDSVVEPDETIQLTLRAPSGATLGALSSSVLTIIDNDTNPPPILQADLELSLSESATEIEVGDGLTLTLTLFNRGPDVATHVVVNVPLPSNLRLQTASALLPGLYDPFASLWTVPSLAAGQTTTLTLNALALDPGTMGATAEVVQSLVSDPDSTPSNGDPTEDDTATVFVSVLLPAQADLQLTKTALPDTVGVEQSLPFYIRVENLGPDDSKDIVIKDTLPATLTFKKATPPDGTTFDDKKLEWKIPRLGSGRFFELELLVTSAVPLKAKNAAEITATGVRDPNRANNRAEAEGQWILYSACGTVKLCHFGNGDPHTNAIVELSQNAIVIATTRTDSQGAFCFKNLKAGQYKIVAKPSDLTLGIKVSEEESIEFGEGQSGGVIQIGSPWPVIRGRVRYPASGPGVEDIEVKLAGKDVNKKTKTDSQGGYLFTDVADGDYTVTPSVPAAGGSFNPISFTTKFQSCPVVSNFVYYGDRVIHGRITTCDKPAKPVLYPIVTLTLDGGLVLTTRASVDGSFGFSNLVSGKYTVSATHPSYAIGDVNVETKNRVNPIAMSATPHARVIGARVVDTHGAPARGIEVGLFAPNANRPTATQPTDASGSVLFKNVANGNWVVSPLNPERKFIFTPATDAVVVGDPKICRNYAVFVSNLSAAEVVAIEVVQVVQDWRNSMPLVEGKQTLVRAFFKPAGTNRTPITMKDVRLKVTQGAGQPATLNARSTVIARANIGEDKFRNQPQSSLAFDITRFAKGDVTLALEWPSGVLTTSPDAVAAGAVNNNATKVTFAAAAPLNVKWLFLDWKFGNKKDAATSAMIAKHRERLVASLPINGVKAGVKEQGVVKWEPAYDPTKDDLDVVLANTFALHDLIADKYTRDEPKDSKVIYYTLVKGIPLRDNSPIPGNYILIRSDISSALYRNRPTHEIGHTLGRHHAVHSAYGVVVSDTGPTKFGPCDEKASHLAPDFPMDFLDQQALQPTLGPMRLGDYRFAYGWDSSDGTYVTPFRTADLMSYCTFGTQWTWPGLYTYTNLFNALENRFGGGRAPAPQDLSGACSIIAGYLTKDGSATLDPVWESLTSHDTDLPPSGEYSLQVFAPEGQSVFLGSFSPDFVVESEEAPFLAAKSRFRFCLQSLGPIGAIEIRHAGQLVLRREATAHAPQVQILFPQPGAVVSDPEFLLKWTASDLDGDSLFFTVDLSSDGGASWSTFVQNLTGTELSVATAFLPGGADIRLRVTGSDGIHQSAAETRLTVLDHAPTLALLSPQAGSLFTADALITLRANAYDPEDGELSGSRFRWSSDRNGALGEGSELRVGALDLEEGLHQISVQATDSFGHGVSDTVAVEIRHTQGPSLAIHTTDETFEVSWPAEADEWQLEATLSLGDPYWFPVSLEPELEGDRFVYRGVLTDETLFLRLNGH